MQLFLLKKKVIRKCEKYYFQDLQRIKFLNIFSVKYFIKL